MLNFPKKILKLAVDTISLQKLRVAFIIALALFPVLSNATIYTLPINPEDNIIGHTYTVRSVKGDTLRKMAKEYSMGARELQQANAQYEVDQIISPGKTILIPAMFILPPGPREGIVVNLDEFRLYYYLPGGTQVLTVPAGIGKDDWNTPIFTGRIVKKKANPEWNVPKSVYEYNKDKGLILPRVMPAGPDNPLGQYALYTSRPGYLIHGTNRPLGVGDRVSSGCLRLRADDIEQLFELAPVRTTIRVTMTPYKIGYRHDKPYLEAHQPLKGYDEIYQTSLTPLISAVLLNDREDFEINWNHIYLIAKQHNGIPQPIMEIPHV